MSQREDAWRRRWEKESEKKRKMQELCKALKDQITSNRGGDSSRPRVLIHGGPDYEVTRHTLIISIANNSKHAIKTDTSCGNHFAGLSIATTKYHRGYVTCRLSGDIISVAKLSLSLSLSRANSLFSVSLTLSDVTRELTSPRAVSVSVNNFAIAPQTRLMFFQV